MCAPVDLQCLTVAEREVLELAESAFLRVAQAEACLDATGLGSEVRASLDEARRSLLYAVQLMRGEV